MPSKTFLNLNLEKRERILHVALKEFAYNNYESASITKIVKTLGIAKGSLYQYFEDKLDLWKYLKQLSEQYKMEYIQSVSREEHEEFWDYFKELYQAGIEFDLGHPYCSLLLYQIGFKETSTFCQPYIEDWNKIAQAMIEGMVEKEQALGHFRKDIPKKIIAFHIITVSQSIAPLIHDHFDIDFDQNIMDNKPLFAGNKKELLTGVDYLIQLLKSALNPIA